MKNETRGQSHGLALQLYSLILQSRSFARAHVHLWMTTLVQTEKNVSG